MILLLWYYGFTVLRFLFDNHFYFYTFTFWMLVMVEITEIQHHPAMVTYGNYGKWARYNKPVTP